jgi:hypothetical protein
MSEMYAYPDGPGGAAAVVADHLEGKGEGRNAAELLRACWVVFGFLRGQADSSAGRPEGEGAAAAKTGGRQLAGMLRSLASVREGAVAPAVADRSLLKNIDVNQAQLLLLQAMTDLSRPEHERRPDEKEGEGA